MVNRNTFRCDDCFKFGKIFWLKLIGGSKNLKKKKSEFLPTLGFIASRLQRREILDLRYRRRSVLA